MLLQHVVGRSIECCREGVHVVPHKTILDTLVLVSAGTPWTTPPGGTSVIPAIAHPRGEAHRGEEAAEPPAYRRDLRLHPLHDRDERGRSAGDQSRKDCRQTGLGHEVAARTLVRSCRGRGTEGSTRRSAPGEDPA